MRKIFCLMIICAAILAGGCESSSFEWSDAEIHVEGKDCNDGSASGSIQVDGALVGEAKIERGKLEMTIGGRSFIFDDKTQEISIDLPPGGYDVDFRMHDDFTGEVTLRTLPKI